MKKRGSISLNGRPSFFPKTKTVTFNEVPTDIGEPRIDISNKGPYFLALVSRYSKEQHPVSYLLSIKRRFMVVAYLHTSWSLPFDAVFHGSRISSHGYIIDVIYALDMLVDVIVNRDRIDIDGPECDYFRRMNLFQKEKGSSFFVDAACLLPYYVVLVIIFATFSLGTPGASWAFFVLRLPQLHRVRRLKDFFRDMEVSVDIDVRKTALVKYAAMVLGAAHWLGCIWWSLASYYDFDASTWVSRYCDNFLSPSLECDDHLSLGSNSTIDDCIESQGILTTYSISSIYDQYLLAYYWGFQSLTNLGYSDLIPDNAIEMVFAWFLCVFQVSFYAYILGTLFSYVVKRDDKAEFDRKNFAALHSYCANRNIPKHIFDRLYSYFEFQLSKSDNDNDIVKSLPNALITKVASFKYKSVVLRSSCFDNVPTQFLTSIMEHLTTRYLMPNERLFYQGDMSRELCFVERGSLQVYADNDEKSFLRTVSADISNESAMVGAYPFFLTVAQPEMVKSAANGDCTVLVLSKEDFLACVETYPECQSTVVNAILRDMGLNAKGDDITSQTGTSSKENNQNDEQDNAGTDFKQEIQQILRSRSAEALYEMIVAATEGDGKKVKDLLLQGLDINTHDFDRRTILHLAAAQGNSKVVQFLLKEGADVHAIDRYGNNPLHESISHNHIAVAELLGRAGAELNYKSPAEHMTKCAGSGDLDKLQTLISYGVDVNCSDKDGRSSLHLVSSEGNLNVVEFLLAHEANPNARDRWGHTPLDGAVEKGHDLVAAALFARGGQMNMKSAKSLFMKSARSGDLGTLKLLIENGIDVNVTDYDQCSALHVAAMADQPVAVDFLLSNKCDVNPLSRWQTTPLDEAVKSQSLLSAKLLLALGGETLEEHVEQDIDVMRSSTLTLTDVRLAISNEASLQSERRRDMHKVKQLHTKLVDDLDESNRIFSQQISDQGQIISKISNTRLSMELPSFKPGDLEFKNLYITLPGFEADTRHVDRAFEDCASNDGDRASLSSKDDLMDSGSDDRHSDNIGGKRGASKTTGFAMMRFLEQNKGKAASTSQAEEEGLNSKFQFQTFNQVMLCLPKVEDGLLYFLKCFRKRSSRRSEAGNLLVKPLELRDCLQLCGLKNIDEESVNKFAREVHDYDFVSERDDFDLSSELELTFAQVLGSEFIVDLFAPNTYAPNYNEDKCRKIVGKSEREDKVHDAFRIIKATFNLFDTDGDGEITPEEIQNQKAVIGDLTYGNEFFRSFDGLGAITISEMATIFSRWTIFSDGDERAVLKDSDADSGSDDQASISDVSSLTDAPIKQASGDSTLPPSPTVLSINVDGSPRSNLNRRMPNLAKTLTPKSWFKKDPSEDGATAAEIKVEMVRNMMNKQSKKQFERFSRSGKLELNIDEFTRFVENLVGETTKDEVDAILASISVSSEGSSMVAYEAILSDVGDEKTDPANAKLVLEKEGNKKDDGKTPWYVLEPNGLFIRVIKIIRTLAAIFYITVIPFECGLIHPMGDEKESMKTLIVGWCVDGVLVVDMASKFHLAYMNKRGFKIVSLRKIRKHYLSHGFVFDLLCLLPVDLLVYMTLTTTSVSSLGYFRIFRLLRCIDLSEYFSRKLAKATSTARLTAEIQILFCVLFALLHLSACFWFALTDPLTNTSMNTYLSNYHGTFSGFGSSSSSFLRFEEYMLAMYWVTGTLTTMGQGGGDLMPQNSHERIFAIFLMLMNLSIYAYILGCISNLFMSADEAIVRKRAEISAVERYITTNRLGLELEKEIRSAMSTDASSGQGVSLEEERAVFKKLSHSLQVQVSKHTCSSLVDNVPAFRDVSSHFKESVCTELAEENFGPGTFVFKRTEPAGELHIIASGTVELLAADELEGEEHIEVADCGVGSVIGEIPFFFNMRHTDSARTGMDSHVRVFFLTREKYGRLLMLYPHEEEKISQNILSKIDLQTGSSGGSKKKGGTSVASDAASSVASSADASSVGKSSLGESSAGDEDANVDEFGSDSGSNKNDSRTSNQPGHEKVDTIKRAIAMRTSRKALQLNYAMCLAAGKGDVGTLKKAADTGLNFDECSYFGRTPLHVAASEGSLAIARFLAPLMETTNIVDFKGNTPLMDAVFYTHAEVAKYLKSVRSAVNENFASIQLSEACADGDEKKVKLLLELGVNPSMNPPGRRRGAARRRRSAAHMAASNNHVGCIKLLIKYWCKLNTFDAWSGTPLADAIRHDHLVVQDVLRKAGAKLKEVGLCTAAAAGDLETIKLMCDNGADINVTNYIGRTMLHLACSNKQASVIEYLLGFEGLDKSPIDWYGSTPLDDAGRKGVSGIAVMMQEAGGKSSKDPSLRERVVAMQDKKVEEKEKAAKSREKEKVLDSQRKKILIKVSKLGHICIVEAGALRKLWDNLLLSLNTTTWKKGQALEKSPKPTLEDVLEFFRWNFAVYMKGRYALNILKCYEVLNRFAHMVKDKLFTSVHAYRRAVTAVHDEFFVDSSPSYVSVNHDSIMKIADLINEKVGHDRGLGGENWRTAKWSVATGWSSKSKSCEKNVFQTLLSELRRSLTEDCLPAYFKSSDYRSIHRHPSGRTWRVLKMCKSARELCSKLELELANVAEEMVLSDEMIGMYKGSNGFDNLTLEGARALRSNAQEFKDKIELIAVIMNSWYSKSHKKASVLAQNKRVGFEGKLSKAVVV